MQVWRIAPGGLLAADWRSRSGLPVINLAGCPTHPNTIAKVLAFLLRGLPLELISGNARLTSSPAWFTRVVPVMNIMNTIWKMPRWAGGVACFSTWVVRDR